MDTHIKKQTVDLDQRYRDVRTVTLIGGLVNFVLAVIKMVVGKVAFSHALFVDGIHSLSDLLSDLLVLFASKQANKHPDEDHPYGHARIETFFTVIFGFILIAVGVGILIDSIQQLEEEHTQQLPTIYALIVAVISIISKEVLFQYTIHFAHLLSSPILKANAWHHRSDVVSSIVVFIGVGGSMYGVPYLDIAAAVIVSMMIAKIGWDLVYESVNELVDKGLAQDELATIRELIENIPGIDKAHCIRTRQMGNQVLVDLHIQVASYLSVSEGHQISDAVRECLVVEIEKIYDVLVHVDPENDEQGSPSSALPLRHVILEDCTNRLAQIQQKSLTQGIELDDVLLGQLKQIIGSNNNESVVIHYMGGKIQIQIFFPFESLIGQTSIENIEKLQLLEKTINTQLEDAQDYIHSVSLGFLSYKAL